MSDHMEKKEVIPADAAALPPKHGFEDHDPGTFDLIQQVEGALKQDMVPGSLQEKLFKAFNPAVKRNIVAQESGLDASVLSTFKSQLELVDAVLRRTFNDDGTVKDTDLAMSPKDVLNLSLKVSQMMMKELPNVYNMDRIQRMESAILETIQAHLSREQQDAFIEALEKRNDKVS